jgi:exodeoxyribonuclease-1
LKGTFYWHDYETWGADPARDRPAQFAGLRTDPELNPVAEPLVVYCRPADDLLPHPAACLVTGITPQYALQHGAPEAEFIARIHAELVRPGTCGVGYNSIRFDDEVTRYTLYRNFFEPYGREWRHGNSRWDLIDVMRMAHALRPEGIEWPKIQNGTTSFRLEALSSANDISHESAHDALSDVSATIGLARLLKRKQPRLYEFALALRDKRQAESQLDLDHPRPLLHVSSKFPAELGCIAPVLPLARHPANRNGILVFDLRIDPGPLLALDADAVRERVFTRVDELPQGAKRIPLKTVHVNRSPMLAPIKTLSSEAAERWQIDLHLVRKHARVLTAAAGLANKVQQVFHEPEQRPQRDPDQDLYGGFLGDEDRVLLEAVRNTPPEELGKQTFPFRDKRLPTLLFRYRARNWPETLEPTERALWDIYRKKRLSDPKAGVGITLNTFRENIAALIRESGNQARDLEILRALEDWAKHIGEGLGFSQ